MTFTQKEKNQIKILIDKGYSANAIVKIVKKQRVKTLKIIREIKNIPDKKDAKLKYTPNKYLKKEDLKKKKRILKNLTNEDKININKLVRDGANNFKIIELIGTNKKDAIRKEIKKVKKQVKKEKIKDLEKDYPKCKFNYTTKSHIGYKFNKKVNIDIFKGLDNKGLKKIIKNIKEVAKKLNNKVRCEKRMRYLTFEYKITLKDSIDNSRISTSLSGSYGLTSFTQMINQVDDLILHLDNLVQSAQSPKNIKIYNIYYVNYDFKNSI